MYDTIIIGGGPAGYSAAIYAGRFGLKSLIINGDFAGSAAMAYEITNYPGIEKTDGISLVSTMLKQAEAAGVEKLEGNVQSITSSGRHCFFVKTESGQMLSTQTVIMCTGTHRRHLGLQHEEELVGKGIGYCATCDAPVFVKKQVAVVGGGDSAVRSAILAAKYAAHVTMIVREPDFMAEPANRDILMALPADRLTVLFNQEVANLVIDGGHLSGITLKYPIDGKDMLPVQGLFIEVGMLPNSDLVVPLGVTLDQQRYIDVDKAMRTNVDGLFAAGDVCNGSMGFWQNIMAAAQGARAAASAYEDIKQHHGYCELHAIPYTPPSMPATTMA